MSPGGDGGVRPGLVVAQLHGGQEVLLGQGHVHLEQIQWRIGIIINIIYLLSHLVLERLVQDAGVGQRGRLRPLSAHAVA